MTLPTGWTEAALGELVDVLDAQRVPVNSKERDKRQGGVPYYGATGQVGWIDKPLFDEELVLLGEDGAPFLDTSKPKAYMISGPSWVNNHAHVLRARSVTSNRFVLHALNAAEFGPYVNGTTRLKLTQAAMREMRIALPPLPEQERIIAAIDQHLSRLDAGAVALELARRRLQVLRSAAAVRAIVGNWPTKRIGDFAHVGSGATPKRSRADYYENGTVPWVTSGQLVNEFVTEPAACITDKAVQETSVKLWPKHTLLVAMYGEGRTRGHCSELLFESTTNQACAAIVVPEDAPVRRDFLKLVFAANYERNRRLASGGVQPNLSLGLVRAMEIPVPRIDDQERIVDEVQRQHSVIDALTTTIEHSRFRSDQLRRGILSQAFTGRLVPQDPDDESASELLARSTAKRVDAPKPRRRQRA